MDLSKDELKATKERGRIKIDYKERVEKALNNQRELYKYGWNERNLYAIEILEKILKES